MFSSSAETEMTCGMKVDTNEPGWFKCMTKVLKNINGASYTINAEEGMAYITGRADPKALLKLLKSGKYTDISWVKTGDHIMYGGGMMMEQPPYNWQHNHYPPPPPPPPPPHHHHQMLPYYQQRPPPSMAYPYNDYYPQYGYW